MPVVVLGTMRIKGVSHRHTFQSWPRKKDAYIEAKILKTI